MSNSPPTAPPVSAEKTFKSYTHQQGTTYAKSRRGYHPNLYQTILDHHTSTNGQLDTLLDVGCGPGTAVRDLAPRFAHAIALDPSEGMISTARSLGGDSASGPIRYEISTAEELGRGLVVADSSVDLLTAATAAHWFDMPRFWRSAARVLKPGGTVAIWSYGSFIVHPSVPNHAAVQATIDELELKHLADYMTPGNILNRELYAGIPLPWTLEGEPVAEFEESSFFRKEWSRETLGEKTDDGGGGFLLGEQAVDMATVEMGLGTASPVTRWREAHPDAVGTENDIVRILRRDIERLLQEAGVEKGKEQLRLSVASVLLMVKKRA